MLDNCSFGGELVQQCLKRGPAGMLGMLLKRRLAELAQICIESINHCSFSRGIHLPVKRRSANREQGSNFKRTHYPGVPFLDNPPPALASFQKHQGGADG